MGNISATSSLKALSFSANSNILERLRPFYSKKNSISEFLSLKFLQNYYYHGNYKSLTKFYIHSFNDLLLSSLVSHLNFFQSILNFI